MSTNKFLILKTDDAKDLPLPSRATPGSSGLDLYAKVTQPVTIYPGQIEIIYTGVKLIIPRFHEIQVRPRGGLAYNHGISIVNSPGTVDEDYRGEICVILVNLNPNSPFVVNRGDRIAQMVLCPVSTQDPAETSQDLFDAYTKTVRGEGRLGSTGI